MRYIDQWLSGLGLDHVIPLLQAHGITTPKKLALLTLRDIYEVVGVEDAEDRKKLYFLIQRLQSILKKEKSADDGDGNDDQQGTSDNHFSKSPPRSPNKNITSTNPSPNSPMSPGRDSPQYPRASFVDVSPLRQPNRRNKDQQGPPKSASRDTFEPESGEDDDSENNPSEDDHFSASIVSGSTDSLSKSAHPTSTVVRDDLKLLRRQHRQSQPPIRESIAASGSLTPPPPSSTPDTSNNHAYNNVRYTSPIVPPKADAYSKRGGPVEVPHHPRGRTGSPPPSTTSTSTAASSLVAGVAGARRKKSPPPPPPASAPAPAPHASSREANRRAHSRSPPPPLSRGAAAAAAVAAKAKAQAHEAVAEAQRAQAYAAAQAQALEGYDDNQRSFYDYDAADETDMAIRVVVRKRPLSRSELEKNEIEVLEVFPRGKVVVHEPKTKVDLTKVIETQEFIFDDAFDFRSTNEDIYCAVMRSLVATMFEGGKGSCFAYGQTGSGKTFTMMGSNPAAPAQARENAGLYVLAARDIFELLAERQSDCQLLVSCFEIYGGKLFDLLNERNPIKCLEDSKQRVQLPGLSEHCVGSVQELLDMMAKAHGQRSTGSTGANEESSRSHQVLQLQLVEDRILKTGKRVKKPCGKLSFIDLAGSERGADTSKNSKQTRMEGAEINTSLLALKEVIRSLEKKHGHTPFRGSKLTQVLKDSFIGENTKTCMVACVSPSMLNCEHTLNTLRYADRVKEHQHKTDPGDRPRPLSTNANVISAAQKVRQLNLDSNMLLKGHDAQSRPSTAVGGRETRDDMDMDDLNMNLMSKKVIHSKKRSSMLQAPKESSRQQNTRMSQQPMPSARIDHTTSSAQGIESNYRNNRISANRMSLNGPPPPPDIPEDLYLQDDELVPMASGIRLRKGSVANGIKTHKGHNNSSADTEFLSNRRQSVSKIPASPRSSSKHSAPPPPPASPPPADEYRIHPTTGTGSGQKNKHHRHLQQYDNEEGERRTSLSSPILLEHVADKHSNNLVYRDRAAEALLSLSALASTPLSPSSDHVKSNNNKEKNKGYYSEEDNSSEEEQIVVHKAHRRSVSPPPKRHVASTAAGGTQLLGKTVALVSAHKLAIAEMVEVMKQEMELVQNMEAADDRDSEAYAQDLEDLLQIKKNSVQVLLEELHHFQKFRTKQRLALEQE